MKLNHVFLGAVVIFAYSFAYPERIMAGETSEAKGPTITQSIAIQLAIAEVNKEVAGVNIVKTNAQLLRPGDQPPLLQDPRAKELKAVLKSKEVWLVKISLSDKKNNTQWTEMVFIDSATGKALFR